MQQKYAPVSPTQHSALSTQHSAPPPPPPPYGDAQEMDLIDLHSQSCIIEVNLIEDRNAIKNRGVVPACNRDSTGDQSLRSKGAAERA
eukprot:COSAG05_NODE_1226_length_5453_cov_6.202279_4_plen_88_part_00